MTGIAMLAVIGPTGVGKSELAVRLAELWRGEIVSADSRALYRGMDVGAAKPGAELRQRAPHHLIDVADPLRPWSLSDYRQEADRAIRDIAARGNLPILVGGTGQYVTALLEGWTPPEEGRSDVLRKSLEGEAKRVGGAAMHARLEALDPVSAGRVDPRNLRRVIRLLEIAQSTGRPPSEIRRAAPPDYDVLRLGLSMPRAELYARLDRRLEDMLLAGLVDEVRALMSLGLRANDPVLSGIGYRQIASALEGEGDLEQAAREIRQANRQLVRKQANWFKPGDSRIQWIQAGEGAVRDASERIARWLKARERATRAHPVRPQVRTDADE